MSTAPPGFSNSAGAGSTAPRPATRRTGGSTATTRSPMSAPPESAAAEQREAQYADIREAVRRFAREQLAPNAARRDREKEFPRDALKGLAAMGLYGVAIPEAWGGAGLDYTSLAIA